jgi:hypothetical protein
MIARPRLLFLAVLFCAGCHSNSQSTPTLRKNLAIDLAQVSAFAVISATSNATSALEGGLRAARLEASSATGGRATHDGIPGLRAARLEASSATGTAQPKLYALTLSGETLEVSLIEGSTPDTSSAQYPKVGSVVSTATWVLFSTPYFLPTVGSNGEQADCSIVAARRADEALFCAPLISINWVGDDVIANAAGDVVYLNASPVPDPHWAPTDPSSLRLYRLDLGGDQGPIATPVFDSSAFQLNDFRVNAAGDVYVNYVLSTLANTTRSEIIPIDGSARFTVQGTTNGAGAIAGKAGDPDENTFYVASGSAGIIPFDGTIRVVTKVGSSFTETEHLLNLENPGSYCHGLRRLSDGIYAWGGGLTSVARVIANGDFVANPTPVQLAGIDAIAGHDAGNVHTYGDWWVFIGAVGDSFEFVRFDGVTRQDIPIDPNLDVMSYTVGTDGAIDFLGRRIDTLEKIHGTVAAGATGIQITSAGVLDPSSVVAFTRIN